MASPFLMEVFALWRSGAAARLYFAVLFEGRKVFGKFLGETVAELLVELGDLVGLSAPALLVDVEDLFKRLHRIVPPSETPQPLLIR